MHRPLQLPLNSYQIVNVDGIGTAGVNDEIVSMMMWQAL